ncbi:AhpC/TSA family protein [Marinibacterium anthonyi]|nr:AhpC/TSA family protein [Marinibacterium anthonyi]
MLLPRQKTPDLAVDTLDHGRFDLASETSERGTVVVVYRGLHCPICLPYLKQVEGLADDLAARGFGVIGLSTDTQDRARVMQERAGATKMMFGYGLDLQVARDWGLYLSEGRGTTSIGVEEPALFAEPGLFIVKPDRTLYFAAVQTMPFMRPDLSGMIGALDFVIAKDYPARGEYAGPLPIAAE